MCYNVQKKDIALTVRDRCVGSLLGLAVGDALGTTIEFSVRDSYKPVVDITGGGPFNLPVGGWTDDTSMALCLAESLIAEPSLDEHDLLGRFSNWLNHGYLSVTGRCFDIGGTTYSGICNWEQHHIVVNNIGESNAGNGGIMRLAPAAIVAHSAADRASNLSVRQSSTTHGSQLCIDSADFLARYLVNLYHGQNTKPVIHSWSESVAEIATTDYTAVDRELISSSGYVVDTLEAAVWAVDRSDSFESAVLLAVNLGGDADTVGAVAGQIAGARWGASSIPADWLDRLMWRDRIEQLADQLYELGNR